MKILATVLLGPGAEQSVPDAIASVLDDVDGFILIESGGGQVALHAALRALTVSNDKPSWSLYYEWRGDYGHARQFALDAARRAGADWALTLDPDERVSCPVGWRDKLALEPEAEVVLSRCKTDGYFKERLTRCSGELAWVGRVCEFMTGLTRPQIKLGIWFSELPKDDAAERRRWDRGVTECQRMIDDGDDRYRWRRHLGSCLMGLGRRAEAVEHYRAALPLAATPEETAWIRYLLAEQQVLDADYDGAARDAALALSDHAGFMPELGWIQAYCDLKRGRLQNASRWAQIALHWPEDSTRVGFRSRQAKQGCRNILGHIHAEQRAESPFTVADFDRRKVFGPNYQTLAGALAEVLAPTMCIDLGAGQGLLVEALRDRGLQAHGVELERAAEAATPERVRPFMTYGVEARHWDTVTAPADLVASVEVLEHVPEAEADAALDALCNCAQRWVYFSAAQPGQPGKGHVNCQPKPYWQAKFAARGFRLAMAETAAVVEQIRDLQPCHWLPRNAMIFEREQAHGRHV